MARVASVISFTVYGEPAPQGSKTVARTKGGRTFVREDNPQTEPWRNAVAAAAAEAMDGYGPIAVPARLDAHFIFARPRSHYGTGRNAGVLKASAPAACPKRPDLDKLLRALGDALTGIAIVDDALFVEVYATKSYGPPSAVISLYEIDR